MKLFSRSKPSSSVDEQPQQGSGVINEEKMMMNNDDERSRRPPSRSTTRTSPFQSERLGRQNMKLSNALSSSDFEKQPTSELVMEDDEYEFDDTDVWYTEGSVECVLGAC